MVNVTKSVALEMELSKAEGDGESAGEILLVLESVEENKHLVEPLRELAPEAQGEHAEAPAVLNVPAGHAVALMEENGQYDPAGQMTGAPLKQKYEGGHGTQVSWRIRLAK